MREAFAERELQLMTSSARSNSRGMTSARVAARAGLEGRRQALLMVRDQLVDPGVQTRETAGRGRADQTVIRQLPEARERVQEFGQRISFGLAMATR